MQAMIEYIYSMYACTLSVIHLTACDTKIDIVTGL